MSLVAGGRRRHRSLLLFAVLMLASVVLPATALAQSSVDLLTDADIRIDGEPDANGLGYSSAGVGDVNGDGVDDVVLGASYAGNDGRQFSGAAYVVYGSSSPASAVGC